MNKFLSLILVVLVSFSFASEVEKEIPALPVFEVVKPSFERIGKIAPPSVKGIKVDTVASLDKPFKEHAGEGKKTWEEENHIIRLGLQF
jgi:hypothetical protein